MLVQELRLELESHTVPVRLSDGGVSWAAAEIHSLLGESKRRILIVTDEHVAFHYEAEFRDALTTAGIRVSAFVLPPGEKGKTLWRVSQLLDQLVEERLTRDDVLIGLGGGVVTDIAGFAAAIYRRGMNWIAVPTSLMGMVDAAIGGKTGVDHSLGKNLIGAFYQPQMVLAPMDVLATLDPREWLAGSAEVVKCGLISGGSLWNLVGTHGVNLYRWPSSVMQEAVRLAAATKIELVSRDERDFGVRRFLNLGHTFGHALESVIGYTTLTHGEAVFLGLRAAVQMSAALDLLNRSRAEEIETVLARAKTPPVKIESRDLLDALGHDKKTSAGGLNWVLLSDVAEPVIRTDLPLEIIEETAAWLYQIAQHGSSGAIPPRRKRILVINGPNLNLLGRREPEIYGTRNYDDLLLWQSESARARNVELLVRQSNIEGELVEIIQRARYWADGIIINPGGYTHTSVAIRDAIAAADVPAVEVHLSDLTQRESFRQVSLMSPVCQATITGKGFEGYAEAMDGLIERLSAKH